MNKMILSVVAADILSAGMALVVNSVKREITIVPTIKDAIFISKPFSIATSMSLSQVTVNSQQGRYRCDLRQPKSRKNVCITD